MTRARILETISRIYRAERMLKIRSGIIYIVIFAIISGSVGPEMHALADQNTSTNTTLVTDPPALEKAVVHLADSNETFLVTEEQKVAIEKELATNAEKKQAGSGWTSAQSIITSLVILAVGALHQKAHQENLQLTPENEKVLVESASGILSALVTLGTKVLPTGYATYVINKKLSDAVFESSIGKKLVSCIPFFSVAATERLFKYLVSSGLLTIGVNYVRGFVTFAAQEVIDHPTTFGGVTPEQHAALKSLQSSEGYAYYLDSLIPSNGQTPKGTAGEKTKIYGQINWKVICAMTVIMTHLGLIEALYSHLFRVAFLQGQNGFVIGFAVVSDILTQIAASYAKNPVAIEGWDKRAFLISIGVGLGASFVPNTAKDWGTAQANSKYADLEHAYESEKIQWEISHFNTNQTPDKLMRNLNSIFTDEAISRQNRFVKYAYLMSLAMNRIDALEAEKAQLLYNQSSQGITEARKPQGTRQTIAYYYNQILGVEYFTSPYLELKSDDKDINSYKNLFQRSASKMLSIYADSAVTFKKFDAINLSAAERYRVALEQGRLQQMVVFINYLSQTLAQQWTVSPPQSTYYPARSLLEQISFWGIHESDISDVIVNGGIVNH